MNERIRELYQQCRGDKYWNGTHYDEYPANIEKFAELIVQECMRMCDVADMSLLEHNCVKEASGTQSAKDFIKEHFGVEE